MNKRLPVLFLFLISFHFSSKSQCLSGNYTIAPSNADFKSILSATYALSQRGVCGPVNFSLAAGTYKDYISIGTIPGSEIWPITFEGVKGNSGAVILTTSSASGPTIRLSNVINIHFNYVTVQSLKNESAVAGSGERLGFNNCSFKGDFTNVWLTNPKGSLEFSHCTFNSPSGYGFYCTNSKNVIVSDNNFIDCYAYISATNIDSLTIRNNVVNQTSYSSGKIVALTQISNLKFISNRFSSASSYSITSATPVPVVELKNITAGDNLFGNNIITSYSGSSISSNPVNTVSAIDCNVKFYHNTINANNKSESSAIYLENGNNVLKNNIFSSTGSAYCISAKGPFSQQQCDYNDFYTTHQYTAKINAILCKNLKTWQKVAFSDSNSVSLNPFYTLDFHCSEINLKAGADIGNILSVDIDNESRNTSKPIIGADEFIPKTLDAAIEGFQMNPCVCAGNVPIIILLKNNGSTEINTADITWSIKTVTQPTYSWSGTLSPGATIPVTLGYYNFLPKAYSYFEVKVTNPNGGADLNTNNDSRLESFKTGLNGNYTVGGSNPDFATIGDAFSDVNSRGACGPVIFNIRDGIYDQTLNFQGTIPGTSSTNTITFKSESNDRTKVQLSGAIFKSSGFIIFSDLTYKRTTSSPIGLIDLTGTCSDITIKNIIFKDSVVSGTNGCIRYYENIYLGNNFVENIHILDNLFIGGLIPIYINAPGGLVGVKISNNQFRDYAYVGMQLENYAINPYAGILVSGNSFSSTQNNVRALAISVNGKFLVEKNNITGNQSGMELGYSGDYANRGTVANNFININGEYGIYIRGGGAYFNYIDLFHNTVNNGSTDTISSTLYIDGSNKDLTNVNNIYSHLGGGYAVSVKTPPTNSSIYKLCDKNNYYTTGRNLSIWNGIKNPKLADLISISHADSNSVNVDPLYEDADNLHILHNSLLDNKGYPGTGITADIDGDIRNNTPDIGADEFVLIPSSHDAGVNAVDITSTCEDSLTVAIRIKCFSTDTLRQLNIKVQLNNQQLLTYHWNGSLGQFDISKPVVIGKFLVGMQSIDIKAWTELPNGSPDANMKNDSATAKSPGSKLNGAYTVGGKTAQFETLENATDAVLKRGVCGPVVFKISDGTYTSSVELYNAIPGASAINTITFESASRDSSKVIMVQKNGRSSFLIATDYIIIKNLGFIDSIKGVFTAYSIQFQKAAKNNVISNCYFKSKIGEQNSIRIETTVTSNTTLNLLIKNNYFEVKEPFVAPYSSRIRVVNSSTNFLVKGVTIAGNFFKNIDGAIAINGIDSIDISKNIITGYAPLKPISYNSTGVLLNGKISKVNISSNQFSDIDIAILLYDIGKGIDRKITNNFMLVKKNAIATANLASQFENFEIYNNSMSSASNGNNSLLSFLVGKNVSLKNNILTLNGHGSLMQLNSLENSIDYNNYYTSSDTFMIVNGTLYNNFKQYTSAIKQDLHSLNFKPNFVSATDLHLNNDLNLDNRGIPINGITTDMDGEIRNKIVPDMGADEFKALHQPNDAAAVSIYTDSNCDGSLATMYAKLYNNGTNTLNNVTIKYSINTVAQPDYNWSGALLPDSATLIVLGGFKNNVFDPKSFIATTWNPNGVTDSNFANDSCFGISNKILLNGVYEIGTNSVFPTISSAFKILKENGICGSVLFKIENGSYDEKLKLDPVNGASEINTVTFTSKSRNYNDVTINNQTDTTLRLLGPDNVKFNNLTFRTGSSKGLMRVENGCDNIKFDSVHFINGTIYSESNIFNKNNIFSNCIFESHFHYSRSPKLDTTRYSLKINNCIFFNSLFEVSMLDTVTIANNRFFVEKDKFYPGSDVIAIYVTAIGGKTTISKNYVEGFYKHGIVTSDYHSTKPGTVTIENNSICGTTAMLKALNCNGSATANIFYNSIYSSHTDTSTANSALIISSIKNVNLKNNIIYNKNGLIADIQSSLLTGSDYNVFFSDKKFFRYEGVSKTFADFKTVTNSDLHSIFLNPKYTSDSDLHYKNDTLNGFAIPIAQISDDIQNKKRDVIHPNPGAFETKADSLLDDINKDLTVTSVGTLDMGNNTVTASFKNSPILNLDPNHIYTGTIDTVDISYQLNNEAPVMEQWTGNLSIGQTTNYSFNTKLSITKGKIYFIAVTAKLHSAKSKDIYAFNDRLSRQVNIKMAGAYYIGGNNPDFIDGDSAMANLVVCHESAPVTFLFRPGHYHLLNPQGSDSLTVMSETGNNTDVEIDMEGIHASNLKIKKVTLSARNNLGWRPLEVASTDLLIDSCIVQGILKGNTYTDGLAIETCGNLTITNNTFKNLNSGITYKDFYSIASSKHEVSKNTFENIKTVFVIYNVGCTIGPTSYIKFHHNKLSNFNSGIEISGQRSIYLKVYNNDLTQAKQSAISVTTYLGTVPLLFYNNFISGGSLLTASYTSTKGSWSSKYFNTIYISSSNLLTFRNNSIYGSLNLVDNTTISFNNNSIYSDTAVTLLSDSFFGFTGDNNNIYSTGNALVYLSRLVGSPYSPVIKSLDTLKSSNTSANQKSISYNPYYTSSTDLHSNSKFLQNKALPDTMIKVDFDGQLRDLNNPDIGADEIDLTTDEVWPGDANGDSKVDNIDLLSIGLYNGSNGLVRATTGINWISYLSNNWGQTQFNLMDYKHADCNGDGAINDKDTLAILQNFGLYHNTNHQPIDPPLINAGNELYFVFPQKPKPGYVTGDTIFAEIWLGKQNATIQNCYGIAFNVATFAECITPGSMHLSIPNNWLGNGQNAYRLHRTNENWGVAFAAFVKKDHVPVTGYGKIATFYFIYNGKSPWDGIPLKFENITAIDQKGNLLNITPYNENIVTGITTETGKQNELSVSPNPFYGNSTINYKIANEAFIKMEVFNNIGQKIGTLVNQKQHPGNYQLKFDSKEYQMENGIYFIRLMNDEHVKILKIVIAN